jgi:amidase
VDSRSYAECDGLELAIRIRRGETTAPEALEQAYRIVERIDPAVHAFVSLEPELASAQAVDAAPGPLAGVPMALKDCVDFLRGAPRRFGSRLTVAQVGEHTDEVVARFLRAGLNPIGTTNVPEFSSSLTTESRLHGPCRNPWNTTRSVGGSSGGAAAAVAYGAVPIAYGNDSAGSIRVPASCCGVFGFKPSRGRVPMGPLFGEIWFGLFTHHVITRSVRDSAAVLDATQGLDHGAPYGSPLPASRYLEECATAPAPLRIAVIDADAGGVALHAECVRALERTIAQLRALGHRVEVAPLPVDPSEMHGHLAVLLAVALAEEVPLLAQASGRAIGPETVEGCHRGLIERGCRTSALELSRALEFRHVVARALGRLLTDFDVWLTPTLAEPPPPLGEIDADGADVDAYLARLARLSPFAAIANFAGAPSMSVPLCVTADGLPLGMMFTGRYADEATLFRLAGQLEARYPWRDRHPPRSAWRLDG